MSEAPQVAAAAAPAPTVAAAAPKSTEDAVMAEPAAAAVEAPAKPATRAEAVAKFAEARALLKSSDTVASDLGLAVNAFESALKMMVEVAGEMELETAPYYFQFGSAMLEEISRADSLMHNDSAESKSKEEAADDLQVAWENMETARIIYSRQQPATKEIDLKMAEVFMRLADHSLETESFDRAYDDYSKCLELQKKCLPPTDRSIAFTLYQLAVASLQLKREPQALELYRCAALVWGSLIELTAKPHLPADFKAPTAASSSSSSSASSSSAAAASSSSSSAAAGVESVSEYNSQRAIVDAILASFGSALDPPKVTPPPAAGGAAPAVAAAAPAPLTGHLKELANLKGIWIDLVDRIAELEITIAAAAANPVSEEQELAELKSVLAAAHNPFGNGAAPDAAAAGAGAGADNSIAAILSEAIASAAGEKDANGNAKKVQIDDSFGFGAAAWGETESAASSSGAAAANATATAAAPVTLLTAKRKAPVAAAAKPAVAVAAATTAAAAPSLAGGAAAAVSNDGTASTSDEPALKKVKS